MLMATPQDHGSFFFFRLSNTYATDTIIVEADIAAIMSNLIPIVGSTGVSEGIGDAVGRMGGVGVGAVGVGVGHPSK